jgi:monoamine oxidase
VGPTQDRIVRVAHQHGMETTDTFLTGNTVFHHVEEGTVSEGSIELPPLAFLGLLDFNSLLVRFEDLARQVDLEHPGSLPGASELDNISVKEWFKQNAYYPQVSEMFARVMETIIFRPVDKVNMLYFLWYAKCGDTFKRLMQAKNGAQEQKFVPGAGQISEHMAEVLRQKGAVV